MHRAHVWVTRHGGDCAWPQRRCDCRAACEEVVAEFHFPNARHNTRAFLAALRKAVA